MGAHLRNGRNISVKQQQRELQRRNQPQREQQSSSDPGVGDRSTGLQRSHDERYTFSPAAAERLRKLSEQSALNYQHRYETTGGKNFSVGTRHFSCLNQLPCDLSSVGNHVQQVDSGAPSDRPINFPGQYEYRDGQTSLHSDPSSNPSDPSPSPRTVLSPIGGRHDRGQSRIGDGSKPLQRTMEYVRSSSGQPEPSIDETRSHSSHLQSRRDQIASGRSGNAPYLRELDSQRGTSRPREIPSGQPNPTTFPFSDNPDGPPAHGQPVSSSSAFDTPAIRRDVPGYWPGTEGKRPIASTPATVYSTPIGRSAARTSTSSATLLPTTSATIPTGRPLPPTTPTNEDCSELRADHSATSASCAESHAPTAPPPASAPRLERIREELETPERSDDDVDRSRAISHASREDSRPGIQSTRQRPSERKGERTTPSTRRTPSAKSPIESPLNLDLEHLSNPLAKEFFLRNINNDVTRSTRQPSDVTYLSTGPVQRGNDRSLPPPPPSTPHPLDVARQEQAPPAQRYYQQPQPQYRQEGHYLPQPQQTRIVQNYAPTTQQQVQAVPNHTHQPPHHQPPHRGSRGSGRNWRRPRDQTTTLIEVGQYLMRAKRIAGRVFRVRGRGRARGRGRGLPPRQEELPAPNHQ
ncbi:hypothetical protein PGT21_022846 [Puccinia graminis f. sp. tritici]|uniref:Uncharacterized protein n=1 Tax=Puccinia graminis f. sp. tritici TaxID=56615 RepID=A0A5B0MM68_PUCGR|nr:hypothetical protein PGT21_022846 [Puccinia graminis f. sp. tritici]